MSIRGGMMCGKLSRGVVSKAARQVVTATWSKARLGVNQSLGRPCSGVNQVHSSFISPVQTSFTGQNSLNIVQGNCAKNYASPFVLDYTLCFSELDDDV